jgi:hypothetical protein
MTFLLNFMNIYQLAKKLLVGTNGQTDRQISDFISLMYVFV